MRAILRSPLVPRDRPAVADGLIIFGVLALALTLNFSRIMRAGYDHDEDQFIARDCWSTTPCCRTRIIHTSTHPT